MSQSLMKLFVKIVVYDQKQWKGGRKLCKWLRIIFISDNTLMITLEQVECNVFYRFQGVVATAVKCLDGTTFESVSRSCKPGNHSIGLGCQLYCNPSLDMYGFPNNLVECQYTEQFSDVTHLCKNLTKVNCGSPPQDY